MQKQEILDRLKKKLSDLQRELKWYDNIIGRMVPGAGDSGQQIDDRENINNDIELFESILELIK